VLVSQHQTPAPQLPQSLSVLHVMVHAPPPEPEPDDELTPEEDAPPDEDPEPPEEDDELYPELLPVPLEELRVASGELKLPASLPPPKLLVPGSVVDPPHAAARQATPKAATSAVNEAGFMGGGVLSGGARRPARARVSLVPIVSVARTFRTPIGGDTRMRHGPDRKSLW
jgi:hypothetical protein